MAVAVTTATHAFLDQKYGEDLKRMAQDVKKTWSLNYEDYPSVFGMMTFANKPVKHNYKD